MSGPFGGGVLIADGGLATTFEARGHDLSDGLWSARLLKDAPDEIVAVHRAFFEAGAVIATTASYQASLEGFVARGIAQIEATELLTRSVELARRARDEVASDGRRRWVAASAGPYGAALADGSEYRGRYGLTVEELAAWHRPRIEVLAAAKPDLLALETVPDVDEALALIRALDGIEVPAWLSYTISGGRTRAGQPLDEAFAVAAESPRIAAVGVNCCAPEDVSAVLAAARAVTDKPLVAYPNSGERWDVQRRHWTGSRTYSPALALEWVAAGARVVGGCCRVGPPDMAAVAAELGGFAKQ
ncbi:homocysteine S-methyltransferase [Rhodococcus sp. D2-41]|uniref:homocysteine S-methyltransferase n=1 Tax=Speluncibacter jeojiensis TaxID=2710754 RepID=UPI0024103B41|nr:homocysteine S-methyltransferase [Rhodococcus sp. D2-41]MDG3008575.1 homocysteine S-methyltransferase [Rhodococcus sp. D2-41]